MSIFKWGGIGFFFPLLNWFLPKIMVDTFGDSLSIQLGSWGLVGLVYLFLSTYLLKPVWQRKDGGVIDVFSMFSFAIMFSVANYVVVNFFVSLPVCQDPTSWWNVLQQALQWIP